MVAALLGVEIEAGRRGDARLVQHPPAEGAGVVRVPGDVGVEVEGAVDRVDVGEAEGRQRVEEQGAVARIAFADRSQAGAGPSRVASSRPRARSGSTNTRSARIPAGIGTSPWRCSPTPTSPSCVGRPSGGGVTTDRALDLLPLTVPEIRHLLAALVGLPPPNTAAVLGWSVWRRRHQQRARRAHWHRRTRMPQRPTKTRKPIKTRL